MRQHKKKIVLASILILVLASAFGFYQFIIHAFGVPGNLYQYYPASTGFYLELAPGEKLTRRFIAYLDEQVSAVETAQNQSSSVSARPENGVSIKAPRSAEHKKDSPNRSAGSTLPSIDTPPNSPESLNKRSGFRRVFLQKFNDTFSSYFSLGVWPDATDAHRPVFDGGHVLVIFPLRENMTLDAVVRRFELDIKDFNQQKHHNIAYIEEKNSGTTLAILNQKLLIANTAAGMQSALAHYEKHAPNVFDEPNNKRYLFHLPWLRQGTFVLNNSVYDQASEGKEAQQKRVPASPMAGFAKLVPVTVGSIQAMPNQRLAIRFMAPIVLSSLTDTGGLRASVQNLFQGTQSFPQARQLPQDTGMMMGITGMDKFYDFYHDFMMPVDTARWLKMMDMILLGFRIDLRRDIISLLENRTVVASRIDAPNSLIVMLDKNEQKDKNLDKISSLLSTNAFPIKQEMAQIGDLSVKTLSLPVPISRSSQNQLSYGTIGTLLVFATPQDFKKTVEVVNQEQPSLAANPSYKAVMDGLPEKSNFLMYLNVKEKAPIAKQATQLQNPAQWLDAIGLSLWATPQEKDKSTLLNGQLNLQLARKKSQ
jgi:hypothetical protein